MDILGVDFNENSFPAKRAAKVALVSNLIQKFGKEDSSGLLLDVTFGPLTRDEEGSEIKGIPRKFTLKANLQHAPHPSLARLEMIKRIELALKGYFHNWPVSRMMVDGKEVSSYEVWVEQN